MFRPLVVVPISMLLVNRKVATDAPHRLCSMTNNKMIVMMKSLLIHPSLILLSLMMVLFLNMNYMIGVSWPSLIALEVASGAIRMIICSLSVLMLKRSLVILVRVVLFVASFKTLHFVLLTLRFILLLQTSYGPPTLLLLTRIFVPAASR